VQVESRRRSGPQSVFCAHTAPNHALEPTAYSFGSACASGGGSPRAFGVKETPVGKFAAVTLLRWIAVIPAGVLGWYIAFLSGLVLLTGATNLCPTESMVSGAYTAPWFRYAEATIMCVTVALAAFLVVVFPAFVAPRRRSAVAWVAFAAGLMVAVYFVAYTAALLEFVSAIVAGLVSVVGVMKAERRRVGDRSLAAPQSL